MTLDYTHWHQHRDEFAQTLIPALEEMTDLKSIRWPDTLQSFEVEQMSDLLEIVDSYLTRILQAGEKFRLIIDQDKRVLAVILSPDQKIKVRLFDKKVVIRKGLIEPLKKFQVLHYNQNLELEGKTLHCFELAPFVTVQFRIYQSVLDGAIHRGYLLQKIHDLTGQELTYTPKLFYSIKRIEQYFIQRNSDPFYIQATETLEKAIETAKIRGNFDSPEYMDLLGQSNSLLEHVFTGDKLLTLLIRDLQHTLQQRDRSVVTTPQKEEILWKIPPINLEL